MARRKHNIESRINAIADRIKKRRLRYTDVTQETIAEELGIHVTSYGRLENGGAELTITKAIDLARYYGITIDELVGYDKDSEEVRAIVQEPGHGYGQPTSANITFQIGGEGDNSPEADRFLKRLGKFLIEDLSDDEKRELLKSSDE
jgi:transcriptional regulator with XRE-family HTH domain